MSINKHKHKGLNKNTHNKLKAFTVFELLISMTLTSILALFAFSGFSLMQQLFSDYTKQCTFISELNQLHSALYYMSNKATTIIKQNENSIVFKTDSANTELVLTAKTMLLKFPSHTDTFSFEPKQTTINLLKTNNEQLTNIVNQFDSDVFYKTQKFHVSFHKQYDAQSILKSELEQEK